MGTVATASMRPFFGAVVAFATVLACPVAQASWYERCVIEGEVESAIGVDAAGVEGFDVRVARAAEGTSRGNGKSYIDCGEYVGERLRIALRSLEPSARAGWELGRQVRFERLVFDAFGEHGMVSYVVVTSMESDASAPQP